MITPATLTNLTKFRGKSNEGARYVWYNETKQLSIYLRSVRSASPMHKAIKSVKKFSILMITPATLTNLTKFRGKSNEGARYVWYNETKQLSIYLRSVRSASPMHKAIKSVKKFSILMITPATLTNLTKFRGKSNEGTRYVWYNETKQFSIYLRSVRSATMPSNHQTWIRHWLLFIKSSIVFTRVFIAFI